MSAREEGCVSAGGAVCQTPPCGQAVTMHSSRMRTDRLLTISDGGGVCPTPLDADPHPVKRMTHAGENITLTQTSFAGGNHGH